MSSDGPANDIVKANLYNRNMIVSINSPRGARYAMYEVSFSRQPDSDFLELAYEEFFFSRGRGLGIERHFPFVRNSSPLIEYACVRADGVLQAGLVMKDCSANMATSDCRVLSIGLVCVHSELRGQGLGKVLLGASVEHARSHGYDAITLWTSKWKVYESVGFSLEDDSLFGWARRPDKLLASSKPGPQPSMFRDASVGIPPFGLDAYELSTVDASVWLVIDSKGPIVASWKGAPDSVAQLISISLPDEWRINARTGDPLVETLAGHGWSFELQPVKLQMWLPLDNRRDARFFAEHSMFTVLDRI